MFGFPNFITFIGLFVAVSEIVLCETSVQGVTGRCVRDEDCTLDKACINGQCRDPCDYSEVCGINAKCHVNNHHPICICPTSLTGDPNVQCLPANANTSSCPYSETPCGAGCCPVGYDVCCADFYECCRSGQICVPYVGICLSLKDADGKISLVSSKSSPVKSLITDCPPGTTTCGVDKCCKFENATCCSDGEHCCPYGYSCDLSRMVCVKNGNNYLEYPWSWSRLPLLMKNTKSTHKLKPAAKFVETTKSAV